MSTRTRPSRDEILQRYRAVRAKLGKAPGWRLQEKMAGVRQADVHYYWPRIGHLATDAGESPNRLQPRVPHHELFADYGRMCLHLGHLPTTKEMRILTRELRTHHLGPIATRAGGITEFDRRFRSWLTTGPGEFRPTLDERCL